MSQYIYRKNQDILWNVVQIIPISSSFNRENMFKQCIKLFYEKNKHRELSMDELRELNQETIEYIICNYGNRNAEPTPNTQLLPMRIQLTSSSQPQPPIRFSPETNSQKSQGYSSELEYRQTEYTNMAKRDVPKEMIFLEKNEDTVIENMEELVAQYLKQRELDTPAPQSKMKIINTEIESIDDIVQTISDESILPMISSDSIDDSNKSYEQIEIHNMNDIDLNKKKVQWDLSTI